MSKIGTKAQVYRGTADKTSGGLTREDLKRNSSGNIVSKAKSSVAKSNPWAEAVSQARKELGITGFVPVKTGSPLYKRAMYLYK